MLEPSGLLEQYRTLREGLFRTQAWRFAVLGFTFAGVGAVTGVTAGQFVSSEPNERSMIRSALLLTFGQFMILSGALVTNSQSQGVALLAEYIRTRIEPTVAGLSWETTLRAWRAQERRKSLPRRLQALGTSGLFGIYYFGLSAGLLLTAGSLEIQRTWLVFPFLVLAMTSIAVSADLYFHFGPGWRSIRNWSTHLETVPPTSD